MHAAAVLQDWIAARALLIIQHPFYLPDLVLAAIFLFQVLKKELTGLTQMPTTFKKSWEGVVWTIAKEELATAIRKWYKRCQKCDRIAGA